MQCVMWRNVTKGWRPTGYNTSMPTGHEGYSSTDPWPQPPVCCLLSSRDISARPPHKVVSAGDTCSRHLVYSRTRDQITSPAAPAFKSVLLRRYDGQRKPQSLRRSSKVIFITDNTTCTRPDIILILIYRCVSTVVWFIIVPTSIEVSTSLCRHASLLFNWAASETV